MNEEKEVVKIPMWKKICYGSAAGGGNIMSTLLATFLLSYYTDTVGIAAASIGTKSVIPSSNLAITNIVPIDAAAIPTVSV